MDLLKVQYELNKRLAYPYSWGRVQNNQWDRKTNSIYKMETFNEVLAEFRNEDEAILNYAMNRWFNFVSAKAIEYMFSAHSGVEPNHNEYDKLVDFTLFGTKFDHKTSVFPKAFSLSLQEAKQNKKELINWLYANQSKEGRNHFGNRLFIVLYNPNGQHWKLKADLNLISKAINDYIENYKPENLIQLEIGNNKISSDVIFVEGNPVVANDLL